MLRKTMITNKKITNKFGFASFICGIAGFIILILMYLFTRGDAFTYALLISGAALAVSAMIFTNLADKHEMAVKLPVAGFVLAFISVCICIPALFALSVIACL